MIAATTREIPNSTTPDRGSQWRAWTEWNGRWFEAISREGATNALARVLVDAGAPDQPMAVHGANGKLRFTVPSIFASARHTYVESGRDGICLVKFRPASTPIDGVKEGNSTLAGMVVPPEAEGPVLPCFPVAAE